MWIASHGRLQTEAAQLYTPAKGQGTPLNICSVRQAKNRASVMLSTNTIADACMLSMLWWWEQ